jgi:hypothetical protein
MLNKIICSFLFLFFVLTGCKQPKCPELETPIDLKDCSQHLQKLMQNSKSDIRGLKLGTPLSGINESDSDFVSKTSFYKSYDPDLDINYWAEVDYYFNENNNVNKVETEVYPGGLTPQENTDLVDSLYFEMKEYLSSKYGKAVTSPDYRLIWNHFNEINSSLTIFSLDYEIPDEEITIYMDDETGEGDTINNPPTVKYIVKHIE